ncbi:MAG: DUF1003 domain-containing protein [Gemmatimonadetes bacterium]|nr:DUF1003 domain-containing protein [Gemmatimonadota bacterium]
MSKPSNHKGTCTVCGGSFPRSGLVPGNTIRGPVAERIRAVHPAWAPEGFVCRADLNRFRYDYVHSLLESERGDLSSLEREVVESLHQHQILARNVEDSLEERRTLGDRLADRLATFGGSWTFLIAFGAFIGRWILMNSLVLLWRPADPYPFILLNLILSCLASVQAPVIMMSQNRQEAKDRLRAQSDYQINLKAELEIRHLHEKVDHLLLQQWERLTQIQEIQLEVLAELERR